MILGTIAQRCLHHDSGNRTGDQTSVERDLAYALFVMGMCDFNQCLSSALSYDHCMRRLGSLSAGSMLTDPAFGTA